MTSQTLPARDYFYLSEAAKLSGLTTYMVDYLCRTKLLVPSGNAQRVRGLKRRYSFGDVVILRVIATLLNSGISVTRLRAALDLLNQHYSHITPETRLAHYLVTDGEFVYFRDEQQTLTNLTKSGQMAFAFVVGVDRVRVRVAKAAARLKRGLA